MHTLWTYLFFIAELFIDPCKYLGWGFYGMEFVCKNKDKCKELVWVPKRPIALWSTPGTKLTEGLWEIGIIIEREIDGNVRVLVNGKLEEWHINHVRPMDRSLFDH